jgi:hypothetical protein
MIIRKLFSARLRRAEINSLLFIASILSTARADEKSLDVPARPKLEGGKYTICGGTFSYWKRSYWSKNEGSPAYVDQFTSKSGFCDQSPLYRNVIPYNIMSEAIIGIILLLLLLYLILGLAVLSDVMIEAVWKITNTIDYK